MSKTQFLTALKDRVSLLKMMKKNKMGTNMDTNIDHELKNKLFVDGAIQDDKDAHGICETLLKMNITKGDLTRLEAFTENKGNYIKPYHGIEFTVTKVVKVAKNTWNSSFYNSIEIYLVTTTA